MERGVSSFSRSLAERVFDWLLGPTRSKRYILGDLREERRELIVRHGRLRAGLWFVWQLLAVSARFWWLRLARMRRTRPVRQTIRDGDPMRTDIKQAVRFLRRRPGLSVAVVLTVALALAAATTVFAVVDGVLLRPLPYSDSDGLVVVWEHNLVRGNERNVVSPANFLTWREEARSFADLAALVETSTRLIESGEAERVGVVTASASYFELVGARPLIGRFYTEAEDREGAEWRVVLSESYWRRRFGADPGVIGRTLSLGTSQATIVGVMPAAYDFPLAAQFAPVGTRDVWIPFRWGESAREQGGRFLQVLGRLEPAATEASAQREMSALAARLRDELPARQAGWDVNVVGLREQIVGDVRGTLWIAFGAVCFVLLIACANVANLLLTRATERQQEIAVRAALGARRSRLIRQLLLESLLLSVTGGVLGVIFAHWAVRAVIAAAPGLPRLEEIYLNPSVIGFAFLATLGAALLFGLAPALHAAGRDAVSALKDRGAGAASGLGAKRLRGALIVAQVALSLVLLIGAGLLVRSMLNRLAVGLGFEMGRLLTAEVEIPNEEYEGRMSAFFEEIVSRAAALPGVDAASAITFAPLAGLGSATTVWVMDRPIPPPGQRLGADIRWVHRDYHRVLGIALRAGRLFDETDREDAPLRVVISEAAAKEFWPGENAVGKRLAMPWGDTLIADVIGVVGDIRHSGPDTPARGMVYWEHRQMRAFQNMTLMIRTAGPPAPLVGELRRVVRELDARVPLYNVRTMEELYALVLARSRFIMSTLGLFAGLALVLAAIGIYGVVAYATGQRTREIGIRMALGANRHGVIRLVLVQALGSIALAIGLGVAGAVGLTRFVQGLLFEVTATDAATFAGMALLLGTTALIACWLPARRASRIDPIDAIRAE
jgi:predicted permease